MRLVFGDISKAFDRVWHQGIIFKLNKYGISGSLNNWFKSFMSNRMQRVVVDGHSSNYGIVNAGVPQGSVLGSMLFIVFINDIAEGLESNVSLYADDSLLFSISSSTKECADTLNSDHF